MVGFPTVPVRVSPVIWRGRRWARVEDTPKRAPRSEERMVKVKDESIAQLTSS